MVQASQTRCQGRPGWLASTIRMKNSTTATEVFRSGRLGPWTDTLLHDAKAAFGCALELVRWSWNPWKVIPLRVLPIKEGR